MKVAVVGCLHGQLDQVYHDIAAIEVQEQFKVELLLICGDFEAIRNPADLQCVATPEKYRVMGDFYQYYSGKVAAPVLTIVVGGNHEASNYMQELPYGGWLAPNIYYLGYAGVVCYGSLRIAGYSGIYYPKDYEKGHYEAMPYSKSEIHSVYHVRSVDIFRLKLLDAANEQIDIFMSHDWPRGIWKFGDVDDLLRRNPTFKRDVENGSLGSEPGDELLHFLKPRFYFTGHMHTRFTAEVAHDNANSSVTRRGSISANDGKTKFLALDKVLPGRRYLEIVDVPEFSHNSEDLAASEEPSLQLDPEWLCILKQTVSLNNLTNQPSKVPHTRKQYDGFKPNIDHVKDICIDFGGDFTIPDNFVQTAPPFREEKAMMTKPASSAAMNDTDDETPLIYYMNPQTEQLCEKLRIANPCIDMAQKTNSRLAQKIDKSWRKGSNS